MCGGARCAEMPVKRPGRCEMSGHSLIGVEAKFSLVGLALDQHTAGYQNQDTARQAALLAGIRTLEELSARTCSRKGILFLIARMSSEVRRDLLGQDRRAGEQLSTAYQLEVAVGVQALQRSERPSSRRSGRRYASLFPRRRLSPGEHVHVLSLETVGLRSQPSQGR